MGMTWIRNSSISPWSKKEAMISPPPIIQISLPGWERRRWAKVLTGSLTNSKVGSGASRVWREKKEFFFFGAEPGVGKGAWWGKGESLGGGGSLKKKKKDM